TPVVDVDSLAQSRRSWLLCAWSKQAAPAQTPGYAALCPARWSVYDKARKDVVAGAEVSAASGRLTARFANLPLDQQVLHGPAAGDLIYDTKSRSLFRVRSVAGTAPAVVTADVWNNHRIRDGACELFAPFVPDAGLFMVLNTRLFMPAWYTQGDFQAGSAQVAHVGRADGYGGYVGGSGE